VLKITSRVGDLLEADVEAFVHPANSLGHMLGGTGRALLEAGGASIQQELLARAPVAVGAAVVTTAGALGAKAIIHVPTMEAPDGTTDIIRIERALRATLLAAKVKGFESVAMPGLGTGAGHLPLRKVAQTMVNVLRTYREEVPERVEVVDLNAAFIQEFDEAMDLY
jgi:O-acetyl-ADP-ribose deacetylase